MTPERWLEELRGMASADPGGDLVRDMLNSAAAVSSRTVRTGRGFTGTPLPGYGLERYVDAVLRGAGAS